MKKLVLATVAAASLGLPFTAGAEEGRMIATATNGKTVSVTLVDGMQATVDSMEEGTDVIYLFRVNGPMDYETQTSELLFEMPVVDMSGIEFTGVASVEGLSAGQGIVVDIDGGILSVSGVESPVSVSVCTLDGKSVLERVIDCDTELDLRRCGRGIHMVRVGSVTFKIMLR